MLYLLYMCFYKHNERMASVVEKRVDFPIEFYHDVSNGPVPSEHFGLSFESRDSVPGSSTSSLVKLDINSTYAQLCEHITGIPLCHVKQVSQILADIVMMILKIFFVTKTNPCRLLWQLIHLRLSV